MSHKDERPQPKPGPSAAALRVVEEGTPQRQAGRRYTLSMANARAGDFGWLTERSGYVPLPDAVGLKAVGPTGAIHGMVVYDGRTPTLAQMHVALLDSEAGAALHGPAFAYPFSVLGLHVLLAMVDSSNASAVAVAKRQGFVEAYRVRDGVEVGTDLILFELRRESCAALKER